jgi:hypothetical protein
VRRLPAVTGWSAALVLFLGGCAGAPEGVFVQARSPACEYRGQPGTPVLILMAQAVPSATLLPCVTLLPAGWRVGDVFIHKGQARFVLASDRVGPQAVTVVLQRFCRLPAVTRVPTDEPGTRRFEQIGEVRPGVGFTGTRFYLFEGGCTRYQFRFSGEERAEPVGQATLALSFITRDEVSKRVREDTGGRADLDPSTPPGR